jgi:hypothetical protein
VQKHKKAIARNLTTCERKKKKGSRYVTTPMIGDVDGEPCNAALHRLCEPERGNPANRRKREKQPKKLMCCLFFLPFLSKPAAYSRAIKKKKEKDVSLLLCLRTQSIYGVSHTDTHRKKERAKKRQTTTAWCPQTSPTMPAQMTGPPLRHLRKSSTELKVRVQRWGSIGPSPRPALTPTLPCAVADAVGTLRGRRLRWLAARFAKAPPFCLARNGRARQLDDGKALLVAEAARQVQVEVPSTALQWKAPSRQL